MSGQPDFVVVGSGLTGAVMARVLTDHGHTVHVLEKRQHVGGNVHDHLHESGAVIHTYGPHYFRTSSQSVWDFVSRFAEFYPYQAKVVSDIGNGKPVVWPPNAEVLERFGLQSWKPQNNGTRANNFEEACLQSMPKKLYDLFVKEYNEKQWGRKATDLQADLCKRFSVRTGNETRLTPQAKWQGVPADGYHTFMHKMLAGIRVDCETDYLDCRDDFQATCCTIYTGPIDHYFGCDLGSLDYRGQKRDHRWENTRHYQPKGQVNNPLHAGGPHIRTLEWKHIMRQDCQESVRGTVVTTETPFSPVNPHEFEYPVPDNANAALYRRYRQRADKLKPKVMIAGRLGEYRYYDMDQAIGRAIHLAGRIIHVSTT